MSCNNTANNILQKGDKEFLWELKVITTHEEQLIVSHPNYKVSCCNVTVKWDIGETITDHPYIITLDDNFICNFYINKKNLLLKVKYNLMLGLIGATLN